MTTRRPRRALAAVASAACLLLSACGTRLDHDTIVSAAANSGTRAPTGTELLPGEQTRPVLGEDTRPSRLGKPAETGAESGTPRGSGSQPGKPAAAASDPAASGKPGTQNDNRAAGGGPIVIGSVGWYSGAVGSALAQIPRGMQAWAATINAKGGLNGRQVKVIVYDDGGDTARSMSLLQKLVEDDKAIAVVANAPPTAALKPWAAYLEKKKVPAIGGGCVKGWNDSGMLFSQCPSVESIIFGTALVGAKFGKGKKFGGLFCAEDAVCTYSDQLLFKDSYAKRAGLDPRYRASISVTQPDFTSECIQARNAGVELMLAFADPNTVGRVASSCRRQNFHPQFLQAGATANGDTVTKPGLGDVLVAMGTFPFAGVNTPAAGEFAAAWKKYGDGRAASPGASQGWAAAKVFEKAARAAGNDLNSATLSARLYGFRNERFGGLTVPLSFSPTGTADSKCVFRMQGQNGTWTAPSGDTPVCW